MTKAKIKFNNQSGFVAAEFLFAFVLVISCGIIVFALTYSLMAVEVAQYITWSSARAYSSGNTTKGASSQAASTKFKNLAAAFPLLTNSDNSWFSLTELGVGSNIGSSLTNVDINNRLGGETRQPWSGFAATLELKLFQSLQIPFLGKITKDESLFAFPVRSFLLRNPSQEECIQFTKDKFQFIKNQLKDYNNSGLGSATSYVPNEDNGC